MSIGALLWFGRLQRGPRVRKRRRRMSASLSSDSAMNPRSSWIRRCWPTSKFFSHPLPRARQREREREKEMSCVLKSPTSECSASR